jgi:hypothetical protein
VLWCAPRLSGGQVGPLIRAEGLFNFLETSMSQKFHFRRRRSIDRTAKTEARAKRRPFIEVLEDRRLMTINLNDPRLSYPDIGKYTAFLPPGITYTDYTSRMNRSTAGIQSPSNNTTASGEAPTSITVTETESNDLPSQANLLNLGTAGGNVQVVNVLASLPSSSGFTDDVDYFTFNLRAGDILSVELSTTSRFNFDVALFDQNQSELIGATRLRNANGALPDSSPLARSTAAVWLGATIPQDGKYFLRVADGAGSYNLRLRALRNSIEVEPVGTRQIVFLDFDGAILDSNIFGTASSRRIPSMIDTLIPYGFQASEENRLIDLITNKFRESFTAILPINGGNGYFSADGRPGAFDIDVRNSRDFADPWGLPNVSRIIIGGGIFNLGIPTIGIAQSVDVGNFDREETAVVLLEPILDSGIGGVPRAPSKSLTDIFTYAVAAVASHEMGHILGAFHQDNTNRVVTSMDSGGRPWGEALIVGQDGIFGTDDDGLRQFGRDRFTPEEFFTGTVDHARTVAFALSTGTRGGSVTGLVFNDGNRNARQDGGEIGLSPWLVYADLNNNGIRDMGEPSSTTDSSGRYNISLGAGSYNLRTVHPAGWIPSTSSESVKTVTITLGATASANFGAVFPQIGATGYKWLDINGDGIRDMNEPGLAGVYIYLDLDADGRPDVGEPATLTKADGSYTLSPPQAGTYRIREVVEAGYVQTFPVSGFHLATFNGSTPLTGFDFGNRESSDWGDAPAPYASTRAQNGASHGVLPGFRLGSAWDAEFDGVNSVNADGDDLNAPIDDEDGITLLSPIVRGDSLNSLRINVVNTAGSPAFLQGWIDFNGNGLWGDVPGERIVSDLAVSAGDNFINFTTPANAVDRTAARFRLSSIAGVGPTGRAVAGEVEDYMFNISNGPRRNLQNDSFTVARNSVSNQFDVLANDFIPPNDPIAAVLPGPGTQGGTVTVGVGNVLRYTPARGFFGQETFDYTVVLQSGKRESATVTVSVILQFIDPVAIDDSFDIPTNSKSFPLNVLLNDIEGKNGALTILSVSTPNKGGSAIVGSGGLSIRYTPVTGFGGTERFTYTAVDGSGKTTTANVTIHTLGGARLDDEAQFSFSFYDMAGNEISNIEQGKQFQVYVYTYDLRPQESGAAVLNPGVYAAYLDVLYNAKLVLPANPGSNTNLDFANLPIAPYVEGVSGSAQFPGVLQSLGAFIGASAPPFSFGKPTLFQKLTFNANAVGIVDFVGDPANQSPNTDVVLYNPPNLPVPVEKVRYLRSTIEVLPSGVSLPFAVDDSPKPLPLNTTSFIDVMRNDIVGTSGPLRIVEPRADQQPRNGVISIDTRGTSSTADDRIQYVPITSNVGFSDQFSYTIIDSRGFTSTATVTLQVGDRPADSDQVKLTLKTFNAKAGDPNFGKEQSEFKIGDEFELVGFVQDAQNRIAPNAGVYAAYQDILYDRNLVGVNSSAGPLKFDVKFSDLYPNGQSGDNRIPGLINEVGSFAKSTQNNPGLGIDSLKNYEQFRIRMKANAVGVARFAGDPADISPAHDTLLFGVRDKVSYEKIAYIPAEIVISGVGSGANGEGHTNLSNHFDVNADSYVSPIDVLLLINLLNQGQGGKLDSRSTNGNASGEGGDMYYVDVDSDGFFTPLDALLIINELNGRMTGGGGEGEGGAAPVVESKPAASGQASPSLVSFNANSSLAPQLGPASASPSKLSSTASLDSYLASLVDSEEEDEEGVDEFLGDLIRVRFQS